MHPTIFTNALSTTARYMIHAAFSLYTFCEKCRTTLSCDLICRWDDWKTMFKEVSTIEKIQARSDALSTVVAIDKAERLYISGQI